MSGSKLRIHGGIPLSGAVRVSSAKNSVLPILAASLLSRGRVVLENVPRIADVYVMISLLRDLGAMVTWLKNESLRIDVPDHLSICTPPDLARKVRASSLFLGSLLGRCGRAEVALPGGDDIGSRPLDLHMKGMQSLGAELKLGHGYITGKGKLVGGKIYLDFPSVGATENLIMAACLAKGQTTIENCAKEPEIVDLASFLNNMGARIRGAGTDVIRVEGVKELTGGYHTIIPDRIEAGTYMIAAAATRGLVRIENVIPTHLHALSAKLREMGVGVEEGDEDIQVDARGSLRPADVKTLPYPGFPTDMQSQMLVLLSTVPGASMVVENVYENRLRVVDELKRMGANIRVEGRSAFIEGTGQLHGAQVKASDLRAGAALIIGGLAAQGETEVHGIEHVDRGYENLEAKLRELGANLEREEDPWDCHKQPAS